MLRAEVTKDSGEGASPRGFLIPLMAVATRPGVIHWVEGRGGKGDHAVGHSEMLYVKYSGTSGHSEEWTTSLQLTTVHPLPIYCPYISIYRRRRDNL